MLLLLLFFDDFRKQMRCLYSVGGFSRPWILILVFGVAGDAAVRAMGGWLDTMDGLEGMCLERL